MGAVENIITDNLPIWSSAIQSTSSAGRGTSGKRNLYGVKKLRELILDLAVRGLLVPQDPSDEPSSVLLERAKADKERLFQEGVIKKKTIFSFIDLGKSKLKVPSRWAHLRLGDIGFWAIGSGFPKNLQGSENKEYFFSKVSDMNILGNEKYLIKANNTVSKTEVFDNKLKLHPPGTVVFPKIGGAIATNKRRILTSSAVFDNNCLGIIPLSVTLSEYLFILLSSIDLTFYQAGTSVPALSQSTLELIEVGLPSIAEQHRIVAKVDELMALCDTLEQQQEDSIQAHEALVEVLLEALSNAVDANAFQAAWGRISEHFDALFTTDHSINKLKETILQLAVMGKLVPQDPSDEPASVLLEKIAAEKERLVKEGKIKKQKPEAKIHHKSSQFTVADGWAKTTFGKVMLNLDSQRIPISMQDRKLRSGPYPYYGASGVIDKIDGYLFDKTLLLIGEDGANLVNRSTPIAFLATEKFWVNNHAHVLDAIDDITLHYMSIHINAIDLLPYITGMAQPKMNQAKMNSIHIMLPPLAEQHRIVAKVDELMALCDQLKNSLHQAQETQILLTDAVVENAL